ALMRRKWLVAPAFLAGLLLLATVDSQGQPPGDGFRGKGKGGRGGFPGGFPGGGGFSFDPGAMWDRMAQGQDSINLNDPRFAFMKGMMERRGEPIPPNGILTKPQFVASAQQRMAQGGMTMRFGGGPPGSPPGGPGTMTFSSAPGADGKPSVVIQGAPGMGGMPGMGMPGGMSANPDEMMMNFFRRADKNGDGRITPDEASSNLRERFQEFDANRDGAIDFNEFKPYMQQRMASRGDRGMRGPFGSSDPRNGSMAASAFPNSPGGWGGSPGGWGTGGNWGGGPPGGWAGTTGDPTGPPDRRDRKADDEDDKPVVYRYGKLPKGIPSWFEEYDDDHDGQVGLYEWRRHGKPTTEFVAMDLNGDGYLTADEWLRYQQKQLDQKAGASASEGGPPRGGPSADGGDRPRFQRPAGGNRERPNGGGDRPRRGGQRNNPFTGGN